MLSLIAEVLFFVLFSAILGSSATPVFFPFLSQISWREKIFLKKKNCLVFFIRTNTLHPWGQKAAAFTPAESRLLSVVRTSCVALRPFHGRVGVEADNKRPLLFPSPLIVF